MLNKTLFFNLIDFKGRWKIDKNYDFKHIITENVVVDNTELTSWYQENWKRQIIEEDSLKDAVNFLSKGGGNM